MEGVRHGFLIVSLRVSVSRENVYYLLGVEGYVGLKKGVLWPAGNMAGRQGSYLTLRHLGGQGRTLEKAAADQDDRIGKERRNRTVGRGRQGAAWCGRKQQEGLGQQGAT